MLEISKMIEVSSVSTSWKEKLTNVVDTLESVNYAIHNSNNSFNLEVSLRDENKQIDQIFFKKVMGIYEIKIKELKMDLLKIEN